MKMGVKGKFKTEYLIYFIFVIGLFILIIPFIDNILYAIPAADDFTKIIYRHTEGGNIFLEGIETAWAYWLDWQGTFFYVLINYWFDPLFYASYESHFLGIELSFLFLIFIGSIIYFVNTCMKVLLNCEDLRIRLVHVLLLIFMLLNSGSYPEVFFWWSGSGMYLTSTAFSMILIASIIKYWKLEEKKWIAGGSISFFGFWVCQEFNTPVFVLSVFLVLIIINIYQKKQVMRMVVPFSFCLMGTLFCVFAPGNFIRQSELDDSGIHLIKACINTFYDVLYVSGHLLNNIIVLVGMFILIISGIYLTKQKIIKCRVNPFFVIGGGLMAMYLSVFPNALAYGSFGLLPNRIIFVLNVFYTICIGASSFVFGCWLGNKYTEIIQGGTLFLSAFAVFLVLNISLFGNNGNFEDIPYFHNAFLHYKVVYCRNNNILLLNRVRDSEDEDVIVTVKASEIDSSDILNLPGYKEDSSDWVNEAIAKYFGKNSLSVIRE